jgi:hypothetical protein
LEKYLGGPAARPGFPAKPIHFPHHLKGQVMAIAGLPVPQIINSWP